MIRNSLRMGVSLLALLPMMAVTGHSLVAPAAAQEQAQSSTMQDKLTFARDFADQVLAILQDPKKSFGDRKTVLRQAFQNSVDINWIARFVLGQAWNTATPEQKARYTELYRKYLTEAYVSHFAEDPDKRIRDIKVFSVSEKNDEDFTVRTQMQLADAENLDVNYLVRTEDGGYKVLDIAIENVSLIATHRAEFSRLAASSGINGVISALQQRLANASTLTLSMN